MKKLITITSILFLLCTITHTATSGIRADGTLNKPVIEKYYFDGNFEQVINALEKFRKQRPDSDEASKAFVFKYLGVIYSSMPNSKEKGKSFLYQLLKVRPKEKLLDMYVSDRIMDIFKEVKAEFEEREAFLTQKRMADSIEAAQVEKIVEPSSDREQDLTAEDAEGAEGKKGRKEKKDLRWVYWTIGGVVVVGLVVVYLMLGEDEDEDERMAI
jgi:hypothetical protein